MSASAALAQADLAAAQAAFGNLVSAIKVATSQLDVSRTVRNSAEGQARTGLAAAVGQHEVNMRAVRAQASHGAEQGQGYGVCSSKDRMFGMAIAEKSSVKVQAAAAAADAAWLTGGGDATARSVALQAARAGFYCSAQERARYSWCTAATASGGTPAGDTDASIFMGREDVGPEEFMVAGDYLDTLAPLPTVSMADSGWGANSARAAARRTGAFATAVRGTVWSVVSGKMGGDDE
ncbi:MULTISPECIES: hypothetical protein [unclassified Xanthobacter]|uniref:hypothetical protein n=1 Tax=unclassified Xanthobacter TaxID=2623496 RepID=UPI001F385EB8|nr:MULTISPECIES: hypothetical protein [unclassified Xanthobacter]